MALSLDGRQGSGCSHVGFTSRRGCFQIGLTLGDRGLLLCGSGLQSCFPVRLLLSQPDFGCCSICLRIGLLDDGRRFRSSQACVNGRLGSLSTRAGGSYGGRACYLCPELATQLRTGTRARIVHASGESHRQCQEEQPCGDPVLHLRSSSEYESLGGPAHAGAEPPCSRQTSVAPKHLRRSVGRAWASVLPGSVEEAVVYSPRGRLPSYRALSARRCRVQPGLGGRAGTPLPHRPA